MDGVRVSRRTTWKPHLDCISKHHVITLLRLSDAIAPRDVKVVTTGLNSGKLIKYSAKIYDICRKQELESFLLDNYSG